MKRSLDPLVLARVAEECKNRGPDIITMFGDAYQVGDWVWCLHCERCYKVGEFRVVLTVMDRGRIVEGLQMCPYDDCDGDAVIDAWPWGKLVDENGYPETPERDHEYLLYPDTVRVGWSDVPVRTKRAADHRRKVSHHV